MVGGKFEIRGLEGACYGGHNFYGISSRCWLTFYLVLLVGEMGSKLNGPVMDAVSYILTMSAHWI